MNNESLLDNHGKAKKAPVDKKRVAWTVVTMIMTFLIYASYHMTRKIPSVVTNVLHPVNSDSASSWGVYINETTGLPVDHLVNGSSTDDVCTNKGWGPFNDDVDPVVIERFDVGVTVTNATYSGLNLTFTATTTPGGYATYAQKDNKVVIAYCWDAPVAVRAACGFNVSETLNAWVFSTRATDPCNETSVLFAASSLSPVPNAVGGDYQACTAVGAFAADTPIVAANGVVSGKELWGDMITLYLAFYAAGLFFSGHVADRMNLKLFVICGMAGSAATVALIGLGYFFNIQTSYYYWVIFGLQGLFQSTGWPAVVALTGPWLGKGKRGLAMGIWNAHTSVGNIMGNYVGLAGLEMSMSGFDCSNNWPMAFILAAVVMTGVNLVGVAVLKSHPSKVGLEALTDVQERQARELADPATELPAEEDDYYGNGSDDGDNNQELDANGNPKKKRNTCVRALCVPGLVEFAVCLFFCKLVAYTFIYWGPSYVAHSGLSAVKAAQYSSFFDYGGIIGGIGAGFIADRVKSQAWVAFGCLVGGIAALFVFQKFTAHITDSQLLEYKLLMMMVGMFVNAPYALITTAVSADLGTTTKGDENLLATVTGIIDGTGSVGAAIQGALIGYVSSAYGWSAVFILLMVFMGLSALTLVRLVVRDTKLLCCSGRQVEGE